MIRVFTPGAPEPTVLDGAPKDWRLAEDAVWIDLLDPTRDEEVAVETALRLQVPTREEMAKLEDSSRLFRQAGATFATADLLVHTDAEVPALAPVTFILRDGWLLTLRYADPRAFHVLDDSLARDPAPCGGSRPILLALLEAVLDRANDVLARTAAEVEAVTEDVFNTPGRTNFSRAIQRLGRAQHANARIADSLASLARAIAYIGADERVADDPDTVERLRSLARDVGSLNAHSSGVAQSVGFQLNAALGLINIEQSGIIKIFSVAAVAFMPPTLIASIYGMNFRHMPEIDQPMAYPLALIAMAVSAVLPLWVFRRKGWL